MTVTAHRMPQKRGCNCCYCCRCNLVRFIFMLCKGYCLKLCVFACLKESSPHDLATGQTVPSHTVTLPYGYGYGYGYRLSFESRCGPKTLLDCVRANYEHIHTYCKHMRISADPIIGITSSVYAHGTTSNQPQRAAPCVPRTTLA